MVSSTFVHDLVPYCYCQSTLIVHLRRLSLSDVSIPLVVRPLVALWLLLKVLPPEFMLARIT
jgi:hypothetical protein